MQIKRLRLTGFKSFVDPADLVIEPGLTGVVGPNGCGKSNLLEALRWTMGENSARSLRGAGMEDVIFAGTATRPPRDFAEVSILLDTDAGEEAEVVRRIERGAGSAYRIDGRDVRAKDVQLLFADAATGAHSPALVSQNRIGAVIAAKPADRRAMLEEAAGIAGLHVRRRDAEARLRATEANLERLDAVIADTDARAGTLRRQARAAERYRALSDAIRVAEARTIFARWREADRVAVAARDDARAAEAGAATAQVAHDAAAAAQEAAIKAAAVLRADALAARDRASDAAATLAAARDDAAAAGRRLSELDQARARIAEDRAREGALANDAAAALTALAADTKGLERALADAERALPVLEAALSAAERAGRDAEVALAQALATQASEQADARVSHAALQQAQARLTRAERERTSAAAAIAAVAHGEPIVAEHEAAVAAEARARDVRERALAALSAAEETVRAATERRDVAERERAAAQAERVALEAEAATLSRALHRGGTRHRMLDLVTVTSGYERALAAALGDDLDVGLDAGAAARWQGAAMLDDDPAAPAGVEPLSRYVSAPDAMARRLAQVFVVDADDGRNLAVGQRVVTRGGAMRRWDGLIATGGGIAAAERLERQNRLAAIEAALPDARAAAERTAVALAAVTEAIAAAQRDAGQARAAIAQADATIRETQARQSRADVMLERIAGQRADAAEREARAARECDEAASDVAIAAAAVAALPDTGATARGVAGLRHEDAARRQAVDIARAARQAGERQAAVLRERLAGAQGDAKSWRARAGDAARRIADMVKRDAEVARELELLSPTIPRLAHAVTVAEEAHGAARADADRLARDEQAGDRALREREAEARRAGELLAAAREARAGAAARADHHEARRVDLGRHAGERFECPAPVLPERLGFAATDVGTPDAEAAAFERQTRERERMGPVNLVAAQELAELESASAGNAAERAELGQAVNRLRGSIGTLNREGRQRLLAAFEAVDGHFRQLFTTLFDGGQAHLELIDSDDPLEAGLEIMAQPPGKRLQSLTLLSGGEQALTAVALIFGLFLTNPAPICVLDEVDAPLDDANIDRFCALLDRMTRETRTRYLVVTHNAVTMSRMHRLFGVTMVERGVSRLVSVDLGRAERLIAAG
ncbi:chromosome segregation protein SMC [Sphingomonas sp. RHCKR47]|uniref:chromosome segregation protein SMC n=1 Tax=Sphingomonas citricola TaxID=2862498 RepID=UPI001CA54BDA|nr:chromosome segregation protein SMC [Sphingomonas citricola]MBW6524489.1 chromosome segregation protein SMC [Sphingomonas citricola]